MHLRSLYHLLFHLSINTNIVLLWSFLLIFYFFFAFLSFLFNTFYFNPTPDTWTIKKNAEKRKVIVKKVVKSRRGSSASVTSSIDESGSSFNTSFDLDSITNMIPYYSNNNNRNDDDVESHVATLEKLAKPTDYVPPKERPLQLSGLNYIVHRLPESKCSFVCSFVWLIPELSSSNAQMFPCKLSSNMTNLTQVIRDTWCG